MQSRSWRVKSMLVDEGQIERLNLVCSMSPTEFEKYCKEILEGYAEAEQLKDFTITHDVKLICHDGAYQIDLYATCTVLGTEIKVICECKRYKNRVSREKVSALHDKIRSLGAHKGILLSTNGFQSGAIQYAKEHGIALIRVYDNQAEFYSHSNGTNVYNESDPFLWGERLMPPYKAVNCTAQSLYARHIYPSRTMLRSIYKEMYHLMKEQYGIESPPAEEIKLEDMKEYS